MSRQTMVVIVGGGGLLLLAIALRMTKGAPSPVAQSRIVPGADRSSGAPPPPTALASKMPGREISGTGNPELQREPSLPPVPKERSEPGSTEFLSKNGKLKAILKKGVSGFASEFQIWDAEKDVRLLRGFNAFEITSFALAPDGSMYAYGDSDGGVSVRTLSGAPSKAFRSLVPVGSLSFSEDGRTLLAPGQAWILSPP